MQVGLPKTYWGDCVLTSAYIINRLPTVVLHHKTRYETLNHKKPTYFLLKAFGYLALAYNQTQNHDKMNPRGVHCVFIGYPASQKGYRVLNLLTK